MPALNSYWIKIHVVAAITGSSLFALGGGVLTILFLIQDRRERRQVAALRGAGAAADHGRIGRRRRAARLLAGRRRARAGAIDRRGVLPAPRPALDRMAYRVIAFAFPIWTFAVIAGAIWAQSAWGRYWGWDPKETWSFVTWVIYAGYLHARSTSGWKGRPAAVIALVGLRVAADHVLRGEPLDRRAALVQGVLTSDTPQSFERRRGGGTVRAARRPHRRRSACTGEARETCGSGCSGSWASLALGLMLASCASARQPGLAAAGRSVRAGDQEPLRPGVLDRRPRLRDRRGRDRAASSSSTAIARARSGCPRRSHGNTRLEIGWTIVPAVILAVVMVPTVATIWDLARKPPAGRAPRHRPGPSVVVGVRQYTDADMKTTYDDQRTRSRSPTSW